MRKEVILITGANGEIGHGLIQHLGEHAQADIVALDLQPLDEALRGYCYKTIQGDILDPITLGRLVAEDEIRVIFHLASILSTKAEHNPETAHRINVEGTLNLLKLASDQSQWQGQAVKFIYPSSIAAYGLPSPDAKNRAGAVKEDQYGSPITMYGINKLYCENLGRYYAAHYRQLSREQLGTRLDFRSLRFPGLVSAVTIPTGGTSDYGPEMLHHAARGEPYACFVRPDTRLPFMVMPDAVKSLLHLADAPRENLTQLVYNVTSFSPTAQDFYTTIRAAFPDAQVTFEPDLSRQAIVDSWPAEVDDTAARRDWGWSPDYDHERAFSEYLIPAVQERYSRHPAKLS